eukprot:gene36372-43287_t
MDTLRANGIDVYVCSASLEDVVAVFASNPKYGYNVSRENVIGLRLERDGNVYKNAYRKNWPLTWGPGKSVAIKSEIVAVKGYGPLFVAGDSDGDYDMLRDFAETRFGMIVNRMKTGNIGALSKLAAAQLSASQPRFLLQGRQESTGNWLPVETSIKYGKTTPLLTPEVIFMSQHQPYQFSHAVGSVTHQFRDLKDLMAKATPLRSGDMLAGVAASNAEQRAV